MCSKKNFSGKLFPWGDKSAPNPQEQRFATYIEGLAEAAGPADSAPVPVLER